MSEPGKAGGLKVGQEYRPYDLFKGSVVPYSLQARRDISAGAKLLFGELAAVKGRFGYCHPSIEHLADRLGTSVHQVERWMAELTEQRLIESRRRGRGQAAERFFVWNDEILGESLKKPQAPEPALARDQENLNPQDRPLNPQNLASEPALARVTEEVLEEVLEEVSSSAAVVVSEGARDDERPSSENRKPEDLEALVTVAQDQLQMARAAGLGWLGGELKQVQRPDRAITFKILGAFADYADFETWLKGTVQRRLAEKSRSQTWGLYLADAQGQAEGIARQREVEETQAADRQAEQERRQAEEAEQRRVAVTPVPPEQAIVAANGVMEKESRGVPEVIKRRLLRLGQPIAPAEVIAMARKFRPHLACERAMIGYAIDGTLRFCDCLEGQELQAEDPGRVEREIEKAHGSLKDRLVATAARVSGPNMADAFEVAEITETPNELIFDAPKSYRMYFKDRAFPRVLEAAGEQRTVRFRWAA